MRGADYQHEPMASMEKPWFLYLLACTDGSIYTGITVDVAKRYAAHRQGKGARYTRSHPPRELLAVVAYPDRSAASKAEWRVKKMSPAEKRAYAAEVFAERSARRNTED